MKQTNKQGDIEVSTDVKGEMKIYSSKCICVYLQVQFLISVAEAQTRCGVKYLRCTSETQDRKPKCQCDTICPWCSSLYSTWVLDIHTSLFAIIITFPCKYQHINLFTILDNFGVTSLIWFLEALNMVKEELKQLEKLAANAYIENVRTFAFEMLTQ